MCALGMLTTGVFKSRERDPPTNMASPILRLWSIKTDSQAPTTLKPHHHPQAKGISPESTNAHEEPPLKAETAECRV